MIRCIGDTNRNVVSLLFVVEYHCDGVKNNGEIT